MPYSSQTDGERGVVTPPKVTPPIDATATDTRVLIQQLLFQMVGLTGALIALFGLSDSAMIVKLYRFAASEQAIPLIGAAAGVAAVGWQLLKAVLANRKTQTLSLLPTTPDTVAIGPAKPSKAVLAAVEQAAERIAEHDAPVPGARPSGQ